MRKNLVKSVFAVGMAFGLLFSAGCQTDLSHKHYLDSYGVCRSCQEDLAVSLSKNNEGIYDSGNITTSKNLETIVKFVGQGENGITVTVDCEDAVVKTVDFYSEKSAMMGSKYMSDQTSVSQTHEFSFDYKLENGVTYYLRFTMNAGGNIKTSVREKDVALA